MSEAENQIHPEMRADAILRLQDLVDRLEAGENPLIVAAYEVKPGGCQLLYVGNKTDAQFRLISRLEWTANALEMLPQLDKASRYDDAAGVTQTIEETKP